MNHQKQTQFYLAEAPVLRSFSGGGLAKADKNRRLNIAVAAGFAPLETFSSARRCPLMESLTGFG